MKITYIGHSGFLAETEKHLLLFDYYKGSLPKLPEEKPLYVFVSHRHEDHFNPEIFRLAQKGRKVTYVLSFDIRLTEKNLNRWGLEDSEVEISGAKEIFGVKEPSDVKEIRCADPSSDTVYFLEGGEETKREIKREDAHRRWRLISLRAGEVCETEDLKVETFRSTDEGVAFLVTVDGAVLYHAGDLHWWMWPGEDKGWLGTMTANFKREVKKLAGRKVDIAFLPLDDRQGEYFFWGMDWYLRNLQVRYAFPMHFWEDDTVVERFCQMECRKAYPTVICDTAHERVWELPEL